MQGEPEAQPRSVGASLSGGSASILAFASRAARNARAQTSPIRRVVLDTENREQAVAHEFEHFAALGLDRRHQAIVETG